MRKKGPFSQEEMGPCFLGDIMLGVYQRKDRVYPCSLALSQALMEGE
jgi:hypothetical protein